VTKRLVLHLKDQSDVFPGREPHTHENPKTMQYVLFPRECPGRRKCEVKRRTQARHRRAEDLLTGRIFYRYTPKSDSLFVT
jgi:hypothetical protein